MRPIKIKPFHEVWLFIVFTLGGLLVRLPYFHLVPLFTDETEQGLHALRVWPGQQLVLSGWDNYIGPFYDYLLGALYFLFGVEPFVPRLLSVGVGALTVGLTYLLARVIGLHRWTAVLAAMFLLTSPHHILVNSRIAWSNSLLPFFTTAFLIVVLYAVYQQKPRWLLLAGVLIGLAVQLHPITALMLPGVLLWFVIESKAKLRSPWPYLAFIAAFLVVSVVIYHNVRTGFYGVLEAQSRSYIWQQNPTVTTYVANLKRLLTQLVGVAGGTIDAGKPSLVSYLYGIWLFAAWVYGIWQRPFRLLAFCFASVLIIMPYFSNHYGPLVTTRLTNHLLPLTGVMMAGFWLAALRRLGWEITDRNLRLGSCIAVGLGTAVLALYPLIPLAEYHNDKLNSLSNNRVFIELHALYKETAVNQPILLSDSLHSLRQGSSGTVAYTTNYLLTMDDMPHETLPAAHMVERLISQPQTALMVLHKEDVALFAPAIPLNRIDESVNAQAEHMGFGVYALEQPEAIQTPAFILRDTQPEAVQPADIHFGEQLQLIGYDVPLLANDSDDTLQVSIYWQALTEMDTTYTGFAHLVSVAENGAITLWGQDDHELGNGLYRTHVWRPDEIIIETFHIPIAPETPSGTYQIIVGAYEWPSLVRLPVMTAQEQASNDYVVLTTTHLEPK